MLLMNVTFYDLCIRRPSIPIERSDISEIGGRCFGTETSGQHSDTAITFSD